MNLASTKSLVLWGSTFFTSPSFLAVKNFVRFCVGHANLKRMSIEPS